MRILLALYSVIALALLLWPYKFVVPCSTCINGATLNLDNNRLEFQRPGIVTSITPPRDLPQQLSNGKGLTIEAWLASSKTNQFGPARIISYSQDPLHRNFTLGQHGNDLVFRMRTSETHPDGVGPQIVATDVFMSEKRQHIVVSYDHSNCQIYVNGQLQEQSRAISGNFSNWDPNYPLLLGNERTGDRPWLGNIEQLAMYEGPMSAEQVSEHYKTPMTALQRAGAVTAFEFSDVTDRIIPDRGTIQPTIPMEVPLVYKNEGKPHFLSPKRRFVKDFISNFAIFLPLGFLVFSALFNSSGSVAKTLAVTGGVVLLYALMTEILQYYVEGRTSAFFDLASCIAGSMVGSFIGWRSKFFTLGRHR